MILPGAVRMRILHLITALNFGGAETMLAKLLEEEGGPSNIVESRVVSLTPPGPAGERIRRSGVSVDHVGIANQASLPGALASIASHIRQKKPDVIMAWMYHAHLAAVAGVALARCRIPIIWNVRHSLHNLGHERAATRMILRTAALLSGIPRAILYNSQVAARQYEALGYRSARTQVIPNGFDCNRFKPDESARSRLVAELGISPTALIVGMAARNHPMKDQATLARAVVHARALGADIHLLLLGKAITNTSTELATALGALPADRVTLREHEPRLNEVLPGFDVNMLSSAWGEGFPNILGEAMACGVPCIATDVGDSRFVVGDTGMIVPPGDAEQMAGALGKLAQMTAADRRMMGLAARRRIEKHFSIREVTSRYHHLFEAVAGRPSQPRSTAQSAATAAMRSREA